jgi:hypothetical protein
MILKTIQQKFRLFMKIATCPVCGRKISLKNQGKRFLSIAHIVPWFLSYEELLKAIVQGAFRDSHSNRDKIYWACDNCLENGKAILADPKVQTYIDCAPYYAYFDLYFDCETCKKNFLFSATEQKFWYESLKFWVQSQPKDCADCRQEKRKKKRELK